MAPAPVSSAPRVQVPDTDDEASTSSPAVASSSRSRSIVTSSLIRGRRLRPSVPKRPASVARPGIPSGEPFVRKPPTPDISLQSSIQYRMWKALIEGGHFNLARCIRNYCEERAVSDNSRSWSDVVDDYDSDRHEMLAMLYTIPTKVLLSIIANTLTRDREINVDVHNFIERHMREFRFAGTYANILAQPRSIPRAFASTFATSAGQGQQSPSLNAGKGLSANQHAALYNDAERYWRCLDGDFVVEINTLIPARGGKAKDESENPMICRYLVMPPKQGLWLASARRRYVIGATDPDTPYVSVQFEVGQSWTIERRLPDHIDNSATNGLFGFEHVWTTHKARPKFKGPLQLALFPIWKHDSALLALSEILGSVLCSSYHDEGGLNPVRGGGVRDSQMAVKDPRFTWGKKEAFSNRRHIPQALIHDYQRQLDRIELHKRINDIPALESKLSDLDNRVSDATTRLAVVRRQMREERDETTALKQRMQKESESNQTPLPIQKRLASMISGQLSHTPSRTQPSGSFKSLVASCRRIRAEHAAKMAQLDETRERHLREQRSAT